jgi:formylglycine-generating enzyme required for sulfatase activity
MLARLIRAFPLFAAAIAFWAAAAGAVAAQSRAPGTVFRDCPQCPELVVLPPGNFEMGSPSGEAMRHDDEGPRRTVRIGEAFALGKYEVTFEEYEACIADGGCRHKPEDAGWGRGRRPVIDVSWLDAQAYVAWLTKKTGATYRLPTEAEWEYAARAGTTTPFSTGPTIAPNQANYDATRVYGAGVAAEWRARTLPVGSFPPNAFGLHDMHGNVSEWVEDCRNESYAGAPTDGAAWLTGNCDRRIIRGGAHHSHPTLLRSASRDFTDPNWRNHVNGFRVLRRL